MKTTGPKRVILIARIFAGAVFLVIIAGLAAGSFCRPHFWLTANQRGDQLFREGKFADAAQMYNDPLRIGVAQYRDGKFKEAAQTFLRVPGADGAFNRANAFVMSGKYDDAITSYGKALDLRPGWKEAEENKALAIARRDKMKVDDKTREQEAADAYEPDKITFDKKKNDSKKSPPDPNASDQLSDTELQATWLRRVQTTPGDFLKTKFAYQVSVKGGAAK